MGTLAQMLMYAIIIGVIFSVGYFVIKADGLYVLHNTEIEGGAGSVTIRDAYLNNITFNPKYEDEKM